MTTNAPRSVTGPMTSTATTTPNTVPISAETIERSLREIGLLPRVDQWIVIDPNGQVYKGSALGMLQLLLPHHPLLQRQYFPAGVVK